MTSQDVVFLFDVDNTLVDNEHVQNDLRKHLERESGPENRDRYWAIFEQLRTELRYADYLGALQRYRLGAINDTKLFDDVRVPGGLPVCGSLVPWLA
jgi:FMN phosphatase YigB (HAD superfamily)